MGVLPTEAEVEQAVSLLVDEYQLSMQLLGKLFGVQQREHANDVLQHLGGGRLDRRELARLLVHRDGPALFAGSKELVREFRHMLLKKLDDGVVEDLFARYGPSNGSIHSPSHMRRPLAEKKWHSSGPWPRAFVAELGFPPIFAGVAPEEKVPTIHDVHPLSPPPALAPFQVSLKEKMHAVLAESGDATRCMVALPTGGGKTRVAVEAFIDWMQPRFANGQYMLWVAQSEELCEQAIACISQMWASRQFVAPLRVYRFFGGRPPMDVHELCGGAVVASINQLDQRIKRGDPALELILRGTGAMVIDEAHRAVSAMYDDLLDRAEQVCGPGLFPICGLTATPGRAGLHREEETRKLVGRFNAYLVAPELPASYDVNPYKYFRDSGYLAFARHRCFRSGCEYELTPAELRDLDSLGDLPPGFLRRLAFDRTRNVRAVERLLRLPEGTPTLVYACTVEHAFFLAAILKARGRRAAALSAETPMALRRGLVHEFRSGALEFLCNFGVLTTGFDAPKTEYIALLRPTRSEVLYEQIVGRGLRGPKFGGTEACTIIDFADNILRHGEPLTYARFEDSWINEYWTSEDVEEAV